MHRVLVLDANQRSALAATRSLGRRGVHVIAADESTDTLSGASRYCRECFAYPSPFRAADDFIGALQREIRERSITMLLPMTEVTTSLILQNRPSLNDVTIPFSSFEAFDKLTDKQRLFKLARQIGVPMPATHFISGRQDLAKVRPHLDYPVVLKPGRSRIWTGEHWLTTSVAYAHSPEELQEHTSRSACFRDYPFMIQEYVKGRGQGIFTLYDQGTPVAFFAHRRLREKPPSGGVSVLCESVAVDARLRAIAEKILERVGWHGVAMVEFKVSEDGTPYLMEVNARFWGSLQLSIDAGIDFPYLLFLIAQGSRPTPVDGYATGVKSRWLLGDLDHLYLLFKERDASKWRAVLQFLRFYERNLHYEVNRLSDLKPFFFELKNYIRRTA